MRTGSKLFFAIKMTLDLDVEYIPQRKRMRRSTADELEVEQTMEQVIESALGNSPSAEDLASVKKSCASRIRLLLKKLVLFLLKRVLG
jgi:hypothetical protein